MTNNHRVIWVWWCWKWLIIAGSVPPLHRDSTGCMSAAFQLWYGFLLRCPANPTICILSPAWHSTARQLESWDWSVPKTIRWSLATTVVTTTIVMCYKHNTKCSDRRIRRACIFFFFFEIYVLAEVMLLLFWWVTSFLLYAEFGLIAALRSSIRQK